MEEQKETSLEEKVSKMEMTLSHLCFSHNHNLKLFHKRLKEVEDGIKHLRGLRDIDRTDIRQIEYELKDLKNLVEKTKNKRILIKIDDVFDIAFLGLAAVISFSLVVIGGAILKLIIFGGWK